MKKKSLIKIRCELSIHRTSQIICQQHRFNWRMLNTTVPTEKSHIHYNFLHLILNINSNTTTVKNHQQLIKLLAFLKQQEHIYNHAWNYETTINCEKGWNY